MQPAPPTDTVQKDPSWNDDEEAAQKRFYIMAGGGLLVILVLAFFVLRPSGDEVAAATPTAAAPADPAAEVEFVAVQAPAAPPVPGTSGGGGGFSGGGGRPGGGGTAAPRRANSIAGFTQERGVALGLSPRAAAAFADSATGRRGSSGPPTSGRATVARATTMMSEPASGTALVTVPSGTPLALSGCQQAAGATWCRATHASFSGWVLQSDIG